MLTCNWIARVSDAPDRIRSEINPQRPFHALRSKATTWKQTERRATIPRVRWASSTV